MADWFSHGYFTMGLLVKRTTDEAFQPLGEEKECCPFVVVVVRLLGGGGGGGEGGVMVSALDFGPSRVIL